MEFSLVTVHVKDMDKSIEFYNGALGMDIVSRREGGRNQLCFLGKEGQPQIELVSGSGDEEVIYSGFSIGFYVDSTDAAVKQLESKGYAVHSSSSPAPTVRITHFLDPNGITIALIETL